ncbi:MAG: pyridoxamine 5'-phosphate oxidase family protein [Microthrixaceae bacterium]|nr:pyridoxamine 5'-phosphate oxidase family protein [Microthrixaceae bacterium]MCB9386733.1 pyridoxamine 5'-phosphate oxidase family protein [Microthrixaceae bacterium]MCO5320615.1 pyridoxamine 5'-phosphate oxidase family protein [Microthrixaceae bacterium]
MPSRRADLTETVAVARPIVERIVWATVATAGADGEPRTRIMHPVWFWEGEVPTALISARRTPVKVSHLEQNPSISCYYWDPAHDTVAVEGRTSWVPPERVADAWERVAAPEPPVGFDPAMIWPDGPTDPGCGFLEVVAHRILATPAAREGLLWSA